MMKPIILGIILISIAGLWTIKFINGEDYNLYKEAKELEAKGDIYSAHDKISEALKINPKNRKVISYKTELYFLVKNDTALQNAYKGKKNAELAMEKGDYVLAAKYLDEALSEIDNMSSMFPKYNEAEILQQEIIVDVDRIVKEAPEKYYLKGQDLYQRGEYERAYIILDYIVNPSGKVVKLKDELAYKLGSDKYDLALKSNGKDEYNLKDSINWLDKVTNSSPDYKNARAKISKLKNYIK